MSERLIEKIDRLGTEAGVETMTPEIRRFALLVRQDTVAQWPDLTEQQRESYQKGHNDGVAHHKQAVKAAQPEQEEDWDAMGQKILAATARTTKRTWEDAAVKAVNKSMQQEQEPIAYLCENAVGHKYFRWKKPSSTYKPIALYTTPPAQPVQPVQPKQEPVAKPYAYEYRRDNGDGTYSVVIEKGDLVQTAPAVYNYVRPRNPHKDWPVKELFDHAPPQRKPLTDEEIILIVAECAASHQHTDIHFARAIERAHGIKELV